ncbi:MAG: helix-turn-helix transcriptional regulator [Dehalococcoidia bacterium]|nr:helix-turn-helix transcriptional regulator [Dehalococcoidia bacterium]
MRRKPGALLPVELAILGAALESGADAEFYGYAIARQMQAGDASRLLTSHGTLYKALDRLVKAGLLTSRWEDAQAAADEERPRRRLYRLTAAGGSALRQAERAAASASAALVEGFQAL